jgi:hypothetical protein
MARGKPGHITAPKTKSFRFTTQDAARLDEAKRLMGVQSEADVLRVLVGRYLEEQKHRATQADHVRAAVVQLLEEQLPQRMAQLLEQHGPELVARVLVELGALGVKRQR